MACTSCWKYIGCILIWSEIPMGSLLPLYLERTLGLTEVGFSPLVGLGHLWDLQSQQKNTSKNQSLSICGWTDAVWKSTILIEVKLSQNSIQRSPPSESPRVLFKKVKVPIEENTTPKNQNLWGWGLEIFILCLLFRLFLYTLNSRELWSSFLGDRWQLSRRNPRQALTVSTSLAFIYFPLKMQTSSGPCGENRKMIPEEHWPLLRYLPFTGPPTSMTLFLYNPTHLSIEIWICNILGIPIRTKIF